MTIEMVLRSPSLCIPVQFTSFSALKGEDGVGVPKGGRVGQVLKKASDADFDTEWQEDVAGGGGTVVTLEGVAQPTFPADSFVDGKISRDVVDGAPASLDTIGKLANALGNDPNFIAALLEKIGEKADAEQTKSALAERAGVEVEGKVDSLEKKVDNLWVGQAPDMFFDDDATAYVKEIPEDVAPYAAVKSVGGMIHAHQLPPPNLFKASVLDAEQSKDGINFWIGGSGVYSVTPDDYFSSSPFVTTAKFKEIFPNSVVGKKYTLTYDAEYFSEAVYGTTAGSIYPSGTFTLTNEIWESGLQMGVSAHYEQADTYYGETQYSNISLTEVGGGERYLTEAKVTALDIVGKNLFDEKAITGGVNGNGAAWNEAVVVTDEYIKVTRGAYGNSLYFTPNQFFLQEGQSVSISADVFIPTGGAPTLGAVLGIGNPIKGFENSALYPKLSAYGQWERHAKTVKANQSGWYYLGLQGDGNASQYDGMDVRFKNIKVTTDTTDTTYSPYHKTTFAIPAGVQALDGYGWGIPNGAHNGVEWDDEGKATFVKRVEREVFNGTEVWWSDPYNGHTYFSRRFAKNAVAYTKLVCDKYPNEQPYVAIPCAYSSASSDFIVIPTEISDVTAWQVQLAQWAAEGKPLTVYYELAEPIVTDISHLITEDNLIPVEGGGVIVAQNENEEAAPSTIIYQKRGV